MNHIKDYFIAEIKERVLVSKRLSKYIASFDYFDKSFIVLSATSGSISIALFAAITGTPVGIASASLSLTFSLSTGLVKKLLKTTRNKKQQHNKIVMLARIKLNSIEGKISVALMNNRISHEDFMITINEERNYRELKESIRMMQGQDDKKIDIDQLIKYKTMLSYCLKCKKDTENTNPVISKTSNGKTMILSKCAVCGSKKSRFIKKQEASGILSSLGLKTPLNKIPLLGDLLF